MREQKVFAIGHTGSPTLRSSQFQYVLTFNDYGYSQIIDRTFGTHRNTVKPKTRENAFCHSVLRTLSTQCHLILVQIS